MKNILLLCLMAISCFASASAQSARVAQAGITTSGDVELLPQTTLYIDVTTEEQDIVAGPYARYTQKYLGITAPLADKVLHEITSVKISVDSELSADNSTENAARTSHMNPAHGFPKLPIDKTSNIQQSPEESARLAAERIFDIRDSRFGLVTGQAGENVFGAGLASALQELDRLEDEYLSLFLGKQNYKSVTHRYQIIPTQDNRTYTVCRFSDTDGLLPEDDLTGRPMVLELKPLEGTISTEGLNAVDRPGSKTSTYRIAADTQCRIVFDGTELTSTVLPVFQLGQTVYIAQ